MGRPFLDNEFLLHDHYGDRLGRISDQVAEEVKASIFKHNDALIMMRGTRCNVLGVFGAK